MSCRSSLKVMVCFRDGAGCLNCGFSGCGSDNPIFVCRCRTRCVRRLHRLAGSVSNRCLAAVWLHRHPFGKTAGCGGSRLAGFALRGGRKIQSAKNGGPVRFRAMRPASAGCGKSGRVLPHWVGRPGGRFCIGRVRAGMSRSSSPFCRTDSVQSAAGCRLLSGYSASTHSGLSVSERYCK